MQLPVSPRLPPDAGGAAPNVMFRAQKSGGHVMMSYFAVSDSKPVTGARYSATAITETTQVLADGNRIVNKTAGEPSSPPHTAIGRAGETHSIPREPDGDCSFGLCNSRFLLRWITLTIAVLLNATCPTCHRTSECLTNIAFRYCD